MKLCITSQGPDLQSPVDARFGRAAMFVVYDTETDDVLVLDNEQNLQAAQGAGIQAAQKVAESGSLAVITGHCGPKAFQVLKNAGIGIYLGAEGTVAEAIAAWKDKRLSKSTRPDVMAHW